MQAYKKKGHDNVIVVKKSLEKPYLEIWKF